MSPRRERTLVVGGYGYGNVGDEAILAGLLTTIGTESVTVLSRSPEVTSRLHGVAAVGLGSTLPALRGSTSVLIGGGGLFGRDMGTVGRVLPLAGLAARAAGRTIVVEGVDLDEQLSAGGRLLVPPLLRRASRVSVRDRRSAEIARTWGVAADIVADLSRGMAPAPPAIGIGLLERAGVDLRRPVIGLALSGVRSDLWRAVRRAIEAAMEALPEIEFCFVPMSRHPSVPSHDDLRAALELQSTRPQLRIVEEVAHPSAVLSAFGALTAVVAMRYHAMLFAERSETPLVPIPYADKNRRWLAERGRVAVAPRADDIVAALRNARTAPRGEMVELMRAVS